MSQGHSSDDFSHLPTVDGARENLNARDLWKQHKKAAAPTERMPVSTIEEEDVSPDYLDDLIPHIGSNDPEEVPHTQFDAQALWEAFENADLSVQDEDGFDHETESLFYRKKVDEKVSED